MAGAFSQPGIWVSLLLLSNTTDRNQTCRNERIFIHSDVQRGSADRQTSFSEQCLEKTYLFRAHCQQVSKTHYSPIKHRRPHCKQDERSSLPCSAVWGTRHPTTGDPLHWSRKAGTSKLPTTWVFFKQEAWPCHVCSRATTVYAFGPISNDIKDRVVENSQSLQTSTNATVIFGSPNVSSPLSLRWQFELLSCWSGLQQ